MVVEPHPSLCKLINMYGKCRCKKSHDALNRFDRNIPYSEKSKNMIDPEGIEIFCHLHESTVPPLEVIFRHLFPVVGRKRPVLALDSEVVGGCARLHIHVKQLG